jgi:hypothetical protein
MPDIYLPDKPAVQRGDTPKLNAGRDVNVRMENALHRLGNGCVLKLAHAMTDEGLPCNPMLPQRTLFIHDCAKCRRDAAYETEVMRRGALHRLNRLATQPTPEQRAGWKHENLTLPFCERCGAAHNRTFKYTSGYMPYCQDCEDRVQVETYWRIRGVFGGDDVEAVLDRIQTASPHLFERGVLPDYWFELMLNEKES